MEGIYTVSAPSSSTTYGNVASAIREMLITHFPYNFFKYINISSELAFRNMRRQFGSNTNNEINKRVKPYLLIKPSYIIPGSDMFLYDVPLTKNFYNLEHGIETRHLFPIYNDFKNNFSIDFKMNRDKIDYDITITVRTLHQQLDIYKAMINTLVWESPFILPASLESMIPSSIVNYSSKLIGVDISDPEVNNIPLLLQKLNEKSKYPITYKIRNASAKEQFFLYYHHGIYVTLSDLSLDEGSRKNMADDDFNITFKVSAEFNLPGLFIIKGTNPRPNIDVSLVVGDDSSDSKEFIPLYTYNNLFSEYISKIDGFRLYTTSMFNTEKGKRDDSLDISVLFDNGYLQVIKEYNDFNQTVDTILRIIVLKNQEELTQNVDYIMDWNSMDLKILNSDYTATYRILLYINSIKINERLAEIEDSYKTDKSGLKDK